MKKAGSLVCGLVVAFVVVTVFATEQKQSAPTDAKGTIETLTKQIDSMQARMKEMEQKLAKLEKTKDKPIQSPAPVTVIPRMLPNRNPLLNNFADPNHPPKIWGEGECNGWKYYMIPLSANANSGKAMPIPLAGDGALAR